MADVDASAIAAAVTPDVEAVVDFAEYGSGAILGALIQFMLVDPAVDAISDFVPFEVPEIATLAVKGLLAIATGGIVALLTTPKFGSVVLGGAALVVLNDIIEVATGNPLLSVASELDAFA